MAAPLVGCILGIAANVAPIPYLATSFTILTALHASIQHVRGIKTQMTALATSVEELLLDLNLRLQGMNHIDESILNVLKKFNRFELQCYSNVPG